MRLRKRINCALFLLYLVMAGLLFNVANASVRIEGFYENVNSFNGNLLWNMEEPHHYFELRFMGNPMNNVEGYLKIYAESDKFMGNNRANRYNLYDMTEAHCKFRWEKGFEIVLFTRENRFWFSQGMMELVSQWTVNNDNNAQGIRIDFWNLWKIYGVIIHSDYSGSSGEDANILRWNLPIMSDRIRISSTIARKDWNGASENHNDVYSGDLYLALGRTVPFLNRFGDIGCAFEVANSNIPDESDSSEDMAYRFEIRDLRFKGLDLKFSYRNTEKDFRSYLSSDFDQGQKYNEEGYNININYLFPTKAINVMTSYDEYKAPVNRNFNITENNPLRKYREWYNELYIEFIHDIRYKFYYKYYNGWDLNYNSYKTYPSLFNEISFENYFAKVRLQFRWKDINTPYEIQAFGMELNANLSEKWKFYARAMNVNEISESRQTVFVQLQYTGWSNTDVFIEFGNPDDSNDDLTNDDDFVNVDSEKEIDTIFKTYLRIYF